MTASRRKERLELVLRKALASAEAQLTAVELGGCFREAIENSPDAAMLIEARRAELVGSLIARVEASFHQICSSRDLDNKLLTLENLLDTQPPATALRAEIEKPLPEHLAPSDLLRILRVEQRRSEIEGLQSALAQEEAANDAESREIAADVTACQHLLSSFR